MTRGRPANSYPLHVIAFVNQSSGGNKGARVLELLCDKIGRENVFDIQADGGPERGLEARAANSSVEVRIIVAGGDGTFSWVATALDKRNWTHCRIIIIPLGSGNDMARALGWGRKFPGLRRVERWVEYAKIAKARKLDVWRLAMVKEYIDEHEDISTGAREVVCNYLSLGVDAWVELMFNEMRWEEPEKFKSRLGNLTAHFNIAFKYVVGRPRSEKMLIAEHIEYLEVDGRKVELPSSLQAILFLNVPSYAAGSQPWGTMGRSKEAKTKDGKKIRDMYIDDRQFEVIGFKGLVHIGTVRAMGRRGVRLAQGKRMTLKLKSYAIPIQVDGEPWMQKSGEITLERGNGIGVIIGPRWKASSKKNAKFKPYVDERKLGRIITEECV